MNAKEILEQAWALIQQPGKWTKHDFARGADGQHVKAYSSEATCFCSIGAIAKVADTDAWPLMVGRAENGEAFKALQALRLAAMKQGQACTIPEVNDRANSVQDLAPMWEEAIRSLS